MQRHYRPRMNVVQRPTLHSGKGYEITGHHEIMVPLLVWAVVDELDCSERQPLKSTNERRWCVPALQRDAPLCTCVSGQYELPLHFSLNLRAVSGLKILITR